MDALASFLVNRTPQNLPYVVRHILHRRAIYQRFVDGSKDSFIPSPSQKCYAGLLTLVSKVTAVGHDSPLKAILRWRPRFEWGRSHRARARAMHLRAGKLFG